MKHALLLLVLLGAFIVSSTMALLGTAAYLVGFDDIDLTQLICSWSAMAICMIAGPLIANNVERDSQERANRVRRTP